MIVTVTPNPSIDRTLRIGPLRRGAVQRARATSAEAAGKGINVARAIAMHGRPALALVPLSDASAGVMRSLLGGAVDLAVVPISGDVRVNVSLVEDDGTVTKINEPGPELSVAEVDALLERAAELAAGASWIAGCGALPPGVPSDFYVRLARRMPEGVRVAVDADGAALQACVGRPIGLLKPNHAELETAVGRSLATLGQVVDAARELVDGGAAQVLVSLGQSGAVLVDRAGATHAEARIDDAVNSVGAGDALLAGFLAAGADRAALRTAVAWSAAACRSPGTQMRPVVRADVQAVVVHRDVAADRRIAA